MLRKGNVGPCKMQVFERSALSIRRGAILNAGYVIGVAVISRRIVT